MPLSLTLLALTTVSSFTEPTDAERVQALILVLQEKNPALRALAAEALGERGEAAKAALPALNTALRDKSGRVCEKAAVALTRIAPQELSELVAALADKQPRVRLAALKAFQEMPRPPDAAVPGVLKCLDANQEAVRVHAVLTAARFGKTAVPALAELVASGNRYERPAAIWSLGVIGPDAALAVPLLLDLAVDPNLSLQGKPGYALARIAPTEKAVIQKLLPLLVKVPEQAERDIIADSIRDGIESQGETAVPFLIEAMAAKDADIRKWALSILAALGPTAVKAVPDILQAHKKAKGDPMAVRNTLFSIGGGGLPAIKEAMKDGDADVRLLALQSWQYISPRPQDALAELIDALADPSPQIRVHAADSLGILGSDAKPSTATLEKLTTDKNEEVQTAAKRALERIQTGFRPG